MHGSQARTPGPVREGMPASRKVPGAFGKEPEEDSQKTDAKESHDSGWRTSSVAMREASPAIRYRKHVAVASTIISRTIHITSDVATLAKTPRKGFAPPRRAGALRWPPIGGQLSLQVPRSSCPERSPGRCGRSAGLATCTLALDPIARASSVRNSERSPGSPPAVTLSTVPDA